jgi:hypothetical protein
MNHVENDVLDGLDFCVSSVSLVFGTVAAVAAAAIFFSIYCSCFVLDRGGRRRCQRSAQSKEGKTVERREESRKMWA